MILSMLMLAGLSQASLRLLNRLNNRYMKLYTAGERGVSSPWYLNGYHIVDEGFIDELSEIKNWDKNIVSIGSSLSVISFQPTIAEPEGGYEYRFLVCGNGCWKSDEQLYGIYKVSGSERKEDIVKLEVSFSTFREMETSITETVVSKWRRYRINPDNSVERTEDILTPVCKMNEALIRMQNVWELGQDINEQLGNRIRGQGDEMIIPGNFRNNYFNYDTVASNCSMDEDMKEHVMALIKRIDSEHELVVELSPLPPGLAETDYGKQFNEYVEGELLPKLSEIDIKVLDYREDYENEEFCDGVHLGYDAGVRYTKKLTEDLNGVIANVR